MQCIPAQQQLLLSIKEIETVPCMTSQVRTVTIDAETDMAYSAIKNMVTTFFKCTKVNGLLGGKIVKMREVTDLFVFKGFHGYTGNTTLYMG